MAARGTVEPPYSYEFTLTGTTPQIEAIFDPPLSLRSDSLDSWLGFGGFHTLQNGSHLNRVDVECSLAEGHFAPKNSPTKIIGRMANDEKSYWKLVEEGKRPWVFHRVTTNRISKLKIHITPTKRSSKKGVDSPPPAAIDGIEIKIYFRFINRGQMSKPNENTFKEARFAERDLILSNIHSWKNEHVLKKENFRNHPSASLQRSCIQSLKL